MRKKITAVICTHNRSGYLAVAMESLSRQSLSVDDYEVIVVDNASTDDTAQTVRGFMDRPFDLRYVLEEKLGLSAARNRGVSESRARYIAFLDDDAEASGGWLEHIVRSFEDVDPAPGCVSGKIVPIWEGARPEWLDRRFEGYLALQDWGDEARFIGQDEWFAGANISYPRHLLEATGGFDEDLGRTGKNLLSMEENLVREKLRDLGFSYYYHPDVLVRHHMRRERLNKDWFVERSYWNGFSQAIVDRKVKAPSFLSRALKALRVMVRMFSSPGDLRGIFFSQEKDDVFTSKCSVNSRLGYVRGVFTRIK